MSSIKDALNMKQNARARSRAAGSPISNGKEPGRSSTNPGRQAIADLRQSAQHAVQSVREGLDNATEMICDGYEGAKESAATATESVKVRIGRNPVAAIGIAAGVGLAVGLMLRRPRG